MENISKIRLVVMKLMAALKSDKLSDGGAIFEGNLELNDNDINALHQMLEDEYKSLGVDLNKVVDSHDQIVEENQLSNYELDEIVKKVDQFLLMFNCMIENKDNLKKYFTD